MHDQEYLSLRLIRLKSSEEWSKDGDGLAFVFPKGGVGKQCFTPAANPLLPGDVLVLNGSSNAVISARESGELVFWSFSANIEHFFPLFSCSELSRLEEIIEGFKTTRLFPAASPLAVECHRLLGEVSPRSDIEHRSQLLRVVAAILSVELKNARPQRHGFVRAEEHMVHVFEKLTFPELLTLSVDDLADKFSCSRRHLNRLFHQYFGLSVASLRMEMRLLKAITLLRNPDMKVINVAEGCGFNHLGLFNTCFKRRFGTTPGKWRKMNTVAESQGSNPMDGKVGCPLRVTGLCPWSGEEGGVSTTHPRNLQIQVEASPRPGSSPSKLPKAIRSAASPIPAIPARPDSLNNPIKIRINP